MLLPQERDSGIQKECDRPLIRLVLLTSSSLLVNGSGLLWSIPKTISMLVEPKTFCNFIVNVYYAILHVIRTIKVVFYLETFLFSAIVFILLNLNFIKQNV